MPKSLYTPVLPDALSAQCSDSSGGNLLRYLSEFAFGNRSQLQVVHMHVSSRTPARILAIEDDPLLAAHLHDHLRHRGFDVTLRQDGEEGLGLAREEDFDLILMDILLPGRSGLEVLA